MLEQQHHLLHHTRDLFLLQKHCSDCLAAEASDRTTSCAHITSLATLRSCHYTHSMSTAMTLGCRDPQHTVLGFSWGSSDEKKMQKSFGLGMEQLFGRFLDLQLVCQGLGYQQMGLTRLTEMVLGCPNHKSKRVMLQAGCCISTCNRTQQPGAHV